MGLFGGKQSMADGNTAYQGGKGRPVAYGSDSVKVDAQLLFCSTIFQY